MADRRNTCVVIRVVRVRPGDVHLVSYYGPFLPHIGSAVRSFEAQLEQEARSGKEITWTVEDVYIAYDESDCKITATR